MNRTRFINYLVVLLVLLMSCETDFNVFADRKEIIVVYGILDQTDSLHFIKINKALPGTGNASEYARIEDSSGFGGNLEVILTEDKNGSLHDIIFDTTSVYNKEPGLFYYPHELLYKSNEHLNQESIYKLKIRDKVTGNTAWAITPLIHDFEVERPEPDSRSYEFRKKITSNQMFKWKSAINGIRYQIIVRFFFKESSSAGDTLLRSVEWFQDIEKSDDVSVEQEMVSRYYNERFFTTCSNFIPYTDQAKESAVNARLAHRIDFIFNVIGKDFNTYLDFNEPLVGVIQDKPEYSNLTNGIGLFSCRFSKTISKKIGQFTELDLLGIENLKFIKNPDNY
jgi:hypothetical protein